MLGNFDPELLMPDYKIENKNNKTKDGPQGHNDEVNQSKLSAFSNS